MGESESDDDKEAFRAETWGAEDDNTLDWAGFDDRLVKCTHVHGRPYYLPSTGTLTHLSTAFPFLESSIHSVTAGGGSLS